MPGCSLFADFAREFLFRQVRRWKPSTRDSNRCLTDCYVVPFFGTLRVAEIAHTNVRCWFDSLSGTLGNANRALPVLSVMMRQAGTATEEPTRTHRRSALSNILR